MSIFSCVIDQVEDVVSQVTQLANQVEEVAGGVRSGMGPIEGGAWTGEGADAFIEEVQTRVIPEIMALIASIGGFGGSILSAMSIVQQADMDVFNVVGNVVDVFDSIF